MLLDKRKLTDHLSRILCGGQIKEAVMHGAFECHAITVNTQLLVIVPPLPKAETLPEEVGILDLDLVNRLISTLSGDGGEVGLEIKGNRLLAEQRHGGKIKMVTAAPSTISTRIGADKVTGAMALFEREGKKVPLNQSTVQGVLETSRLLKATQINLTVGPEGSTFVVGQGNEHSHTAEFALGQLKADVTYELPIDANILTDVFSGVSDFTQAELVVTGPDSLVMVQEGGYKYVISPQRAAAT